MSKTLLAIDDSVTMRKVFEITFAGEDFNVLTAENGKAGLGKASENPSVVLIDTSLDGEDGYAVCKELRQKLPKAGIILLASRHNPYDANKAKDAGADDFADKPFDTQQLIDKVKKVVLGKESGGAVVAPASTQTAAAAPASASMSAAAAPKSVGSQAAARSKTLVFGPEMIPAPVDPSKAPPKETEAKAVAAKAAPVAASPKPSPVAAAVNGHLAGKLGDLGLTKEQIDAVVALSREVIERVVWEVVPTLAETLIKEEIARLTK